MPAHKQPIANKENLAVSERKKDYKGKLRSKTTFGEDITKRANEPPQERFNFTLPADSALTLPTHLAAPASFSPETAPYEEAIVNYIISTHSEQEFPLAYRKKIKNPKLKRRYVV